MMYVRCSCGNSYRLDNTSGNRVLLDCDKCWKRFDPYSSTQYAATQYAATEDLTNKTYEMACCLCGTKMSLCDPQVVHVQGGCGFGAYYCYSCAGFSIENWWGKKATTAAPQANSIVTTGCVYKTPLLSDSIFAPNCDNPVVGYVPLLKSDNERPVDRSGQYAGRDYSRKLAILCDCGARYKTGYLPCGPVLDLCPNCNKAYLGGYSHLGSDYVVNRHGVVQSGLHVSKDSSDYPWKLADGCLGYVKDEKGQNWNILSGRNLGKPLTDTVLYTQGSGPPESASSFGCIDPYEYEWYCNCGSGRGVCGCERRNNRDCQLTGLVVNSYEGVVRQHPSAVVSGALYVKNDKTCLKCGRNTSYDIFNVTANCMSGPHYYCSKCAGYDPCSGFWAMDSLPDFPHKFTQYRKDADLAKQHVTYAEQDLENKKHAYRQKEAAYVWLNCSGSYLGGGGPTLHMIGSCSLVNGCCPIPEYSSGDRVNLYGLVYRPSVTDSDVAWLHTPKGTSGGFWEVHVRGLNTGSPMLYGRETV